MNFEKQIAEALLKTGLIRKFYHGVQLVKQQDKTKAPAYSIGNELFYVGPDDSREDIAYMRVTGPSKTAKGERISSAGPTFKVITPQRIVITSSSAKPITEVFKDILEITNVEGVKIVSFSNDSEKIGREETGIEFINEWGLYCAIDIQIAATMHPGRKAGCEQNCETLQNPICL